MINRTEEDESPYLLWTIGKNVQRYKRNITKEGENSGFN
jgi:hypothetical protein